MKKCLSEPKNVWPNIFPNYEKMFRQTFFQNMFEQRVRTNRKSRAMPQQIVTQGHSHAYSTRSHLDRIPRISDFVLKI